MHPAFFTALVPGSLIAMTAATLLAKNLIGLARPWATDDETATLAKWLVPVVMLVSVYFTIAGSVTIVTMLLVGYSFVTLLFPAVIASRMPHNPVAAAGAFAGILVGVAVAAVLTFTHATLRLAEWASVRSLGFMRLVLANPIPGSGRSRDRR